MDFAVRRSRPDELEAVNARYAAVDFLPSSADDLIVCAEIGGAWAAQGRLVRAGAGAGELGGILVSPDARGRGLAKDIVAALLADSPYPTLYCLPFAELEPLYAEAGFSRCAPDGVPDAIARKYGWCNAHYGKPVLLMVRRAAAAA